MKIRTTYTAVVLTALTALMVGGCAADLPVDYPEEAAPLESAEDAIIVMGGKPSGLPMASRAGATDAPVPSRPGYCNADMLRVWVYEASQSTPLQYPGISALTASALNMEEVKLPYYGGTDNCNKLGYYHFTSQKNYRSDYLYYATFAAPALAYSEGDRANFETTEVGYTEQTLSLKEQTFEGEMKGYIVPELYFGRLIFDKKGAKDTQLNENNGTFNIYKVGGVAGNDGTDVFKDRPLRGTLYRIVSQLNVKVTKVNVGAVRKIEMYVENLPTAVKLYGSHGTYYPIAAATGEAQHTARPVPNAEGKIDDKSVTDAFHLVASTTEFTDSVANISTFLLPSDEGLMVRMRLYTVDGHEVNEAGERVEKIVWKDYDLQPANSVYLTGEDVKVYDAKGEPLTIYDGTTLCFRSYANVRVNVSGKFEDVFADRQNVDVNVEVCPSFEGVHNFEFNY